MGERVFSRTEIMFARACADFASAVEDDPLRAARIRNLEPFPVVILVSSDPRKVDAKTRSKWSRLLRYADQFKPDTERLADFVKSQGGINECAAQWSDQVTRTGEKVDQ
jgi:hypothetical protein